MKRTIGKIVSIITLLCVGNTLIASNGVRQAVNDFMVYCASNHCDPALMVEKHAFSTNNYGDAPFANAIAAVSNNWQAIIDDLSYYGTNSEMAIIIPHLAGFAGTNAWIGIWNALLDIHATDTNRCPLGFISETLCPAGTPLEHFAHKNYTLPNISNLLLRTQALYPTNDLEEAEYFRSIFSGEYKLELEFEENWEHVSFEYANAQLTNSLPK